MVIPTKSMVTPEHHVIRYTTTEIANNENGFSYTLRVRNNPPEVYNIIHTSGVDLATSSEHPGALPGALPSELNENGSRFGIKNLVKKLIKPVEPKQENVEKTCKRKHP